MSAGGAAVLEACAELAREPRAGWSERRGDRAVRVRRPLGEAHERVHRRLARPGRRGGLRGERARLHRVRRPCGGPGRGAVWRGRSVRVVRLPHGRQRRELLPRPGGPPIRGRARQRDRCRRAPRRAEIGRARAGRASRGRASRARAERSRPRVARRRGRGRARPRARALVNALDPEAVVVGGGLGLVDRYRERLARAARAAIEHEATRELPIVPATLGPRSGVVGAALATLR